MMTFPTEWKNKTQNIESHKFHVPNHQPGINDGKQIFESHQAPLPLMPLSPTLVDNFYYNSDD